MPPCLISEDPIHDGLPVVSAAADVRGSAAVDVGGTEAGVTGELGTTGAGASSPSSLVPPGPTRSRGTSGSGDVSRMVPALRGRVSRNWAPIAGRPHAVSQPPWRFASSMAMDRPRPDHRRFCRDGIVIL